MQQEFSKQFASAVSFSNYLQRARRLFARGQGWRKAHITTMFGLNSSGSFRPLITLLKAIVQNVGGWEFIDEYRQTVSNGKRVFTSFFDADMLRLYTEARVKGSSFLCIDVYADGTTLAR